MSLINDALKRAKEAQQQTPPPALPGPQLRPVEPAQYARRGAGLVVPIVLGLIALLGLFMFWQRAQQTRLVKAAGNVGIAVGDAAVSKNAGKDAGTPGEASPAAASSHPSVAAMNQGADSSSRSPSKTGDEPSPPHAPSSAAITSLPAAPQPPGDPASAVAVTNPVAAPPPPKPAPLRLQAIFFTPTRPSAMIGGKTLFVGDRLGELRLVAITQNSATLAGVGQTNVLSLAEQ